MQRRLILQAAGAILLLVLGFAGGAAWVGATYAEATPTPPPTRTSTSTRAPASTSTATPAPSATPSATPQPSPTATTPRLDTATPGPSPTIDFPDGVVLEQSNCRYGPGAGYLYEWGLYAGDRVEIRGRNDLGTWVYVKPRSYGDLCWVKTSLLEVSGDVYAVLPYYNRLPFSELYLPPNNVRATRLGNNVQVAWDPVWMTEDDYRGYLIEAWLCVDRQIIFTPVSIDGTSVVLKDEPGCVQPSGGRLYTAEKHGYTQWVMIPWPPFESPTPAP